MGWMVLGPTKWKSETKRPDLDPDRLGTLLPPSWELQARDPPAPVDVRAAAVGLLQARGRDATLMEFHDRADGESNTDLFHRIRRDEEVDRFLVYWPYGAQRTGLDWELGLLAGEISRGETSASSVTLLVEDDAASIDPAAGELESHERGKRTRYYNDLIEHGCPHAIWNGHEAFFEAVLAWTDR